MCYWAALLPVRRTCSMLTSLRLRHGSLFKVVELRSAAATAWDRSYFHDRYRKRYTECSHGQLLLTGRVPMKRRVLLTPLSITVEGVRFALEKFSQQEECI